MPDAVKFGKIFKKYKGRIFACTRKFMEILLAEVC